MPVDETKQVGHGFRRATKAMNALFLSNAVNQCDENVIQAAEKAGELHQEWCNLPKEDVVSFVP